MSANSSDFGQFMKQREEAAQAYVQGDPAPLHRLVATSGSATFLGPGGGSIVGAGRVDEAYRKGAATLSDGETRFEVEHMAESDDLAFWTGVQRATVRVDGGAMPVPMDLRITEVFRREGKQWKLIHRHADPMVKDK
jgi:ketosteroid isomerase-like protein